MADVLLIDANVLLRWLTADDMEGYEKSREILLAVERGDRRGVVPDFIVAEVVYVLARIYGIERERIVEVLEKLLLMEHLETDNKIVTFQALQIYRDRRIDFADALLCARSKLMGYDVATFDKKLLNCLR
jgi:predicted nucleic-acid-binding protein